MLTKDLIKDQKYVGGCWINSKEYIKGLYYVGLINSYVEYIKTLHSNLTEEKVTEIIRNNLNDIVNVKINIDYEPNLVFADEDLLETFKAVQKNEEIIKKVLLRNGVTIECKAKDLLVVDDMKCVKDNIKKYPDSVVILSSEILVIK